MQELSFDPRDPVVEFSGWRCSLQIITFENLYGIAIPVAAEAGQRLIASASRLTLAGARRSTEGAATMECEGTGDETIVRVEASAPTMIRCLKLILRGLPQGELVGHRWRREPVPPGGVTVHYPQTTHSPLVMLALADETYLYFEALDPEGPPTVHPRRFTAARRDDGVALELISEAPAAQMSDRASASWRIGRTRDPRSIIERHERERAAAFGLGPWESRADVPPWARDVALVAAVHGMHWTGYVFNDYAAMRDTVGYLADRAGGRRVIAFLPGWEGRYYWQYGDYRPEPLLGGDAAFARLAARARERGIMLMPMFGMHCANRDLAGFDGWGAPSEMRSPSGLVFQGNRPDWDTSRAHDPGWQAWLNPGSPPWRQRLLDQISALVTAYDLPAIFFDTTHVYVNDPRHDVYTGMAAVRDELKSRFPDLLIAGEGWYDALGAITPVSHTPAHVPAQWPTLFSRYCRGFLHLATGDLSRGSTGVHEQGTAPPGEIPDVPYLWPTITLVDGTLEHARSRVDALITEAVRRG